MKLYRHYKQKMYKRTGLARHSESLEELVLYETLYDTEYGRSWARPRELFDGEIEVEGRLVRRFAEEPIEIDAREAKELVRSQRDEIGSIGRAAFEDWDPDRFSEAASGERLFHFAIARHEGRAVGFKLGYQRSASEFYSWLGAVLPAYRDLGIGAELMRTQHAWCREKGYAKISTKTLNRWREMLIFNLKAGFEIVGTEPSERGIKILMERKLG